MPRTSTRLQEAAAAAATKKKSQIPLIQDDTREDEEEVASDYGEDLDLDSGDGEDMGTTLGTVGRGKQPGKKYQRMTTEAQAVVTKATTTTKKLTLGKRVRGKLGLLRDIAEMPLDVTFEIFSHLAPQDLLSLARTTKSIRAVILAPSAKGVWKDAFENVERLPECPPHLSLPVFAGLLFDKHCHFCNKSGHVSTEPLLEYGVRSCARCIPNEFWLVPSSWENWAQMMWGEVIRFYMPKHELKRSSTRFLPPRLAAEYTNACLNFDSRVEREEWLAKLKKTWEGHYALRNKHDLWQSLNAQEVQQAENERKDLRKQDVLTRLRVMGWGEELTKAVIYEIGTLKAVGQPTKLTENTWKKILPELIKILEAGKVRRLATELAEVVYPARNAILTALFKQYVSAQPKGTFIPALRDVASFPEFRSVTENTPATTKVTAKHYSDAFEALPRLSKEWQDHLRTVMLKLVPPQWRVEGETEEAYNATLARACVMFNVCRRYLYATSEVVFGLDVLEDPSVLSTLGNDSMRYEKLPTWLNGLGGEQQHLQYVKSEHAKMTFAGKVVEAALNIMVAFGVVEEKEGEEGKLEMQEKMKNVTREEMRKRKGKVMCGSCARGGWKSPMTWDEAMIHVQGRHQYYDASKITWKLVR